MLTEVFAAVVMLPVPSSVAPLLMVTAPEPVAEPLVFLAEMVPMVTAVVPE